MKKYFLWEEVSHGALLLNLYGHHGGVGLVCCRLWSVGSDWFWSGGRLSNPYEGNDGQ